MVSVPKILIPAALSLLLVAPLVGASAAHPHPHTYVGTSLNGVSLNLKVEGLKVKYALDSAVVGYCVDGSPFLRSFFPPEPVRDGDSDIGIGGGCFAYETVYGNDAGATLTVALQESMSTSLRPVWVACVDVNGDGTCAGALNEPYNICTNGANGAYSLSDGVGGACTIYADPAATLNPAVFILVIGGIEADGDAVTPNGATAGNIFLF